jgi:coenzyme F420-reducing hydrogenase delta subunit
LLRKILEQLGIEQERVQLHWVCASCGDEFVNVVNKMTAEIRELGPLQAGASSLSLTS